MHARLYYSRLDFNHTYNMCLRIPCHSLRAYSIEHLGAISTHRLQTAFAFVAKLAHPFVYIFRGPMFGFLMHQAGREPELAAI